MLFVGYAEKSKGHLYCLTCHTRVVQSINAVFFKDAQISMSAPIKQVNEQPQSIHAAIVIEKGNVDDIEAQQLVDQEHSEG